MIVYLSSPNTQQQAGVLAGQPVLLSFAIWSKWMGQYEQSFGRILIDSGAFSEFSTGKRIDLVAYREWAESWRDRSDAVAGLDDISGDWKRSLKNYEAIPFGFPTFHESDPEELLPDLCAMAKERGGWIGIGLIPPRTNREEFMRRTLERIPEGLHVHGWALRGYAQFGRLNSVDSTNWWRDAMALRARAGLDFLTYQETLEIIVKRYARWTRPEAKKEQQQLRICG